LHIPQRLQQINFFSPFGKALKTRIYHIAQCKSQRKTALSVFSEICEYAIQSLVTTVCPERGPRKLGREGGLEEAVLEDFWVYYVWYAVEGRTRIYGDMPEFWGSSLWWERGSVVGDILVYGGIIGGVVSYRNLFS